MKLVTPLPTYLLCHPVHLHAVITTDVFLLWVIFPRTQYQHFPGGDTVKQTGTRLVILSETVIFYVDYPRSLFQ